MKGQISMIPGYEYEPPEVTSGREKMKRPQEMYGLANNGKTCKTCQHCGSYTQSRTWYKCDQWSRSHSIATDIRLSWPACGRYKEEKHER